MDQAKLDPIARDILIPSYLETAGFSRAFRDGFGQPPTLATKVHYMRSIAQVMVTKDDRFTLGADFAEFGRVEIVDHATAIRYVLRSEGNTAIDRAKREGALFDSTRYLASDVILLVYRFHRNGLDLFVAGSVYAEGKYRLHASGKPTYIATWSWTDDGDGPEGKTFDQGGPWNPFGDIGDIGDIGEEGMAG